MAGIPPSLLQELRQLLVEIDHFSSNAELRRLFVDPRIKPWRNNLPEADNLTSRVNAVINYLHNQHRSDTQENVLSLFLLVLSDQFGEPTTYHGQLIELAQKLSTAQTVTLTTEQHQWNTAVIRQILIDAYNDEDLTTMVYDHFYPVHAKFTDTMTKTTKVQLLVQHCIETNQVQRLLTYLQTDKPYQYSRFEKELILPTKEPTDKPTQTPPGIPSQDIWTRYENAVKHLLKLLAEDEEAQNEVLIYQQRLQENLDQTRLHGDTEARRATRSEIITGLNSLARRTLNISFNDLSDIYR